MTSSAQRTRSIAVLPRLPKLCGADIELGNFIRNVHRPEGSGAAASRAVLREIVGLPCLVDAYAYGYGSGYAASWNRGATVYDRQDWGRKYLPTNGGCVYIDLDHVEACIPEVVSAYDHVAAWHAMLRIVRRAQVAANERQPNGQRIQILVNNSDGQSNSYGSHLNFLITRRAWENLYNRKLHYQLFLAAFQASSIIITGAGKVGAENGAPPVAYQLAQRADFFETLCGVQTTSHRPLVNSRDEPLCGRTGDGVDAGARLHCIFFDNTLCPVASLLKVGMMQIILAMIEAEEVDAQLLLEDPVDAVQRWSHDPTLQTQAARVSGAPVTALELQSAFLAAAARFVNAGGCKDSVPRAPDIVHLWDDTLRKLAAGDLSALAGRLDWVLKRHILEQALRRRPHLSWRSPEIKMLDHLYSSLDPADGLYWAYEAGGMVEPVVNAERIAYFEEQPPEETRAWTRAMLLRLADPDAVESVDWDRIVFRAGWSDYQHRYRHLDLANPLGFNKAETEHVLCSGQKFDAILDALGASDPAPRAAAAQYPVAYRGNGFLM